MKQNWHSQLGYNAITNCKISFVENTFKLHHHYDFYAWIDFGILQDYGSHDKIVPSNLDLNNIPFGVTYGVQNKPNEIRTFKEILQKIRFILMDRALLYIRVFYEEFNLLWRNKVDQMHQMEYNR